MQNKTALIGAAFLMATSAIGPGFLTQTASFTSTLLASFGFVILISIILDIGAQLNIWRVIGVAKKKRTRHSKYGISRTWLSYSIFSSPWRLYF